SWWQALPLGPTGYGDSPYQSPSSFAGNSLLISPDWLIEDGLLRTSDCAGVSFPATAVDFDAVKRFKYALLETAWKNFNNGVRARPDRREQPTPGGGKIPSAPRRPRSTRRGAIWRATWTRFGLTSSCCS